jgi:UDP-N-acetylglucosamine 1-carboxyvinyltransferase
MEAFEIRGGKTLRGEITPQGAKNEALQIICATLLTDSTVVINNIPDIEDVNRLISLLEFLGVEVVELSKGSRSFCAKNIMLKAVMSPEYRKIAAKLRGSFLTVGPLLARFNESAAVMPGGDKIGRRRVDTHFLGFQKLGATIEYDAQNSFFHLKSNGLKGTYILLDEASVTGTANIVMAAVLAKGTTTIFNAACEPYLQQLCKMLNSMGAKISGVGSNLLTIEGVQQLGGCTHTMLPDMIEVGSFIGLSAMTKSEITIKGVGYEHLGVIPEIFSRLGIYMERQNDDIYLPPQDIYEIDTFMDGSILTVSDAPWPGFTPDLLSIVLVVATQAKGSVLIHQKMFESRLFFVDKLIDMGAQVILCDPHRATVIGLERKFPLKGISMSSPDIRAGVALLIAALSAEGKSIIFNIEQIHRGYSDIENRLKKLGAEIRTIS